MKPVRATPNTAGGVGCLPGASSTVRRLGLLNWMLVLSLVLLLNLLTLSAMAVESVPSEPELPVVTVPAETEGAEAPSESPTVEIESPDTPLPEETVEGPTEQELLVSINTYLTYIFGFGVVFIAVLLGKLVYRFFNMFF